jgi:predicted Zn-dependent protease
MESRTLANNPSDFDASHRANSTAAMLGVRLSDRRPFYEQTGRGRRSLDLGRAEKAYRQSLASHPDSEAQLRLARVLSLQGKDEEAHTRLERLLAASHDPRVLYLAHLFLADIAARRHDSAVATSEYQAALAANPLSRIAYVGLSNLALLAGNGSDAQEHIRDWSLRDASPPDKAWTEYEKGIDQLQPTLNALLRMIAQ